MSAKKANKCSPSLNWAPTASRDECCPTDNKSWHEGITLLTALALRDGVDGSRCILPEVLRGCLRRTCARKAKLNFSLPPSATLRASLDREIKSNALTPSTDVIVVSGLISVKPWSTCATHSHPAFVRRAYWYGEVAASIVGPSSWPQVCESRHQRRYHELRHLVSLELSCDPASPSSRLKVAPPPLTTALPPGKTDGLRGRHQAMGEVALWSCLTVQPQLLFWWTGDCD